MAQERRKTGELGEAKKRMSALANKRSVMISARFSGPLQDDRLREVARRLERAEGECRRVGTQRAKEAKKTSSGSGRGAQVGAVCLPVYQVGPV